MPTTAIGSDFPFQMIPFSPSMANSLQAHENLFLTFLHILLLSTLINLSSAFHSRDNHLINCGSTTAIKIDDRSFSPDSDTESVRLYTTQNITLTDGNPSPDSSPLYHTARVFQTLSSYEFLLNNKGYHLIRLHFSPFSSQEYNLYEAVFHLSALGFDDFVLLEEFHVLSETPVVKEFFLKVDEERLVISVMPITFAFINAIEVFTAPAELVPGVARLVTPNEIVEGYHGLSEQAFEAVYRINVGGPMVTPFNDTVWRTWVPDHSFLKLGSSSKVISYSGWVNYQLGGASRLVAPDNVYNSARVLKGRASEVAEGRITWSFPVNLGHKYLIRMHFCDIVSKAANELYFNVFINGFYAYKDLDLSDIMNQMLAAPYYIDFVADPVSSGAINISIGTSGLSDPSRVNVILNGLEIMRMNNSLGSLAGELPASRISEVWAVEVGIFLCSVLGAVSSMSLLVYGFKLLLRRVLVLKNSAAWLPLPTSVIQDKKRYVKVPSLGELEDN